MNEILLLLITLFCILVGTRTLYLLGINQFNTYNVPCINQMYKTL
jgi:hypothetical protein